MLVISLFFYQGYVPRFYKICETVQGFLVTFFTIQSHLQVQERFSVCGFAMADHIIFYVLLPSILSYKLRNWADYIYFGFNIKICLINGIGKAFTVS